MKLFIILAMLLASPVLAGKYPNPKTHNYDPENGDDINQTCAACHGEFGEGGGGGEYPRLAGMPARYLAKALHMFKVEERNNVVMSMYATEREISADDLLDISIFLSEIELMSIMPDFTPETTALEKLNTASKVLNIARYDGDFEKGKLLYSEQCAKCHGADGSGKGSRPRLAGQYTEYIRLQIENFRTGERTNKPMDKYIMALTDEDIEALLAWLSIADD